ncbi:unnamed protein product [Rotaria socialis]|uniref:Uncharacterized protein n=1 Tax=Rotaria socialis TaxID=392032 RepID=A0A820YHG0_9BILA|nr:unnamed protein product [Rotaria socialis]CAF4549067.1 unnamed protein product [Rotaria socialis]
MSRLRLLHYDKQVEINVDEKIDFNHLFIAATYRQLILASQSILTIYDLSSILLGENFNSPYQTIITPNPILALTSTADRIIYVYHSLDNFEQLKICILNSKQEEQSLTIESLNVDSKIHLCSLDDGTIFIGYNSKIFSLTNEQWSLDSKIIKMCSGKEHVLVLLADGRILSWGNGLHGALGLGDLEPSLQPTQVESLSNDVIDIAAGGWHSLVLLADGSAMSWGWNNDGALGLDTSDEDNIAGVFCDPTLVTCLPLDIDCKYVSAGARHSAFIGSNDYVWLCGSNKHGQLGTPSSFSIEKGTIVHCLSWFTLLISQEI